MAVDGQKVQADSRIPGVCKGRIHSHDWKSGSFRLQGKSVYIPPTARGYLLFATIAGCDYENYLRPMRVGETAKSAQQELRCSLLERRIGTPALRGHAARIGRFVVIPCPTSVPICRHLKVVEQIAE